MRTTLDIDDIVSADATQSAGLIIGTFRVGRGLALLHTDRDSDAMARHLPPPNL